MTEISKHTTRVPNCSLGAKNGLRNDWAGIPVWASFVEGPAPGVPMIGFTRMSMAVAMASRKVADAVVLRNDPGYPGIQSCPVQLPDGSWGYWTRHSVFGHVDDGRGWLVLAGGRVINGRSWYSWSMGQVLDGRFPTIWMSQNMRRPWAWQVDRNGHLTQTVF